MFSKRPIDARGRWIALTVATIVYQFVYWPIVSSVAAADETASAGLWVGLAFTPMVFLILAFTSRHPRAPGATARAMGLFLLIALPIGLLNIVVGLAAGFGAGATAALRREEYRHSLKARVLGVIAAAVYLLVLTLLGPQFGGLGEFAVMSGAVVPLAAVGLADEVSEARSNDPEPTSSS